MSGARYLLSELVKADAELDKKKEFEDPFRPPESVYEGVLDDSGKHPMLKGVDIGAMGHEKAA